MNDVRAVANWVLDFADEIGRPISNLAINKVVFFLHCEWLFRYSEPLVSAKIEAWQHGPVFRELYHEFKIFEGGEITGRAKVFDIDLRKMKTAELIVSKDIEKELRNFANFYVRLSASELRNLSHIKGGAWDIVFNQGERVNPGMKISDDLIVTSELSRAKH